MAGDDAVFGERGRSFEKKFALSQEAEFKAQARRNRALGLWAAQKMGRSPQEAEAYAGEVIAADLEEAGDEDVFRKLRRDFDQAEIECSDHEIRREMEELLVKARAELAESG